MRHMLSTLTGICVLVGASAHAGVVLSDDFNLDAPQLNWPGDAVFTSVGPPESTDLVGPGFFGFLCQPGQGNCVDLDGSTGYGNNPAGLLLSTATFGPGKYVLTFDLAGNQRGAPSEATAIHLGAFSASILLPSSAPWRAYSYSFSTASSGQLSFLELGPSDQQGNVLDNVTLTAVPEPASWAMMLVGLGLVGGYLRRRGASAAM